MRWWMWASLVLRAAASLVGKTTLSAQPVIFVTPVGWCESGDVERLVRVCVAAAAGGADAVQLRDPGASRWAMVRAGRRVSEALASSDCAVVVNGDVALAVEARVDGAHLPERLLAAEGAGARGSALDLVGCSAHSVSAALAAAAAGVDYVQLGTMFATETHPGKVPEGLGLARAVAGSFRALGETRPRLLGVGGVDATNAKRLADSGCDGAAVIRAISQAPDPAVAVRSIRSALEAGTRRRLGRDSDFLPPELDAPD